MSGAGFATALLDPAAPVPAGLVAPTGRTDAKRFAVYRNNVFVSLVGALESRFPVTRRLVGDDFFRGMARTFAADHRPASPVLMHYGDDFPVFIAGFGPTATVPYLSDIARLEAAWSDSYNAADRMPLALAALAAVAPENLPNLRLVPHPAAAILASTHPVGSIWAAHNAPEAPRLTARGAETVLVTRPALEVEVAILPPADAPFATALFAGATIADAVAATGEGFDFGAALVGLVSRGAFAAIAEQGREP